MRIRISWHVNGIELEPEKKNLDGLTLLGWRLTARSRRYDNQQGQAKSDTKPAITGEISERILTALQAKFWGKSPITHHFIPMQEKNQKGTGFPFRHPSQTGSCIYIDVVA